MTVSYKKTSGRGSPGQYYVDCQKINGQDIGIDDYYSQSAGEPAGKWYVGPAENGSRISELGLDDGRVFADLDSDRFMSLCQGFHPENGEALVNNAGYGSRLSIHDFTCSAPKSVSTIWSQADGELRNGIEEAQEHATRKYLDLFGKHAYGRTGKDGGIHCKNGLRGATFSHSSSRLGDPQLHTHAVCFNLVEIPRAFRIENGQSIENTKECSALQILESMKWQGAASRRCPELSCRLELVVMKIMLPS